MKGSATNRRDDSDDALPWKEETRPVKAQGVYGNFFDNVSATAFPKWQATSRSR